MSQDLLSNHHHHHNQFPFMYQGHSFFLDQAPPTISGLPCSRLSPVPSLFTHVGDREDPSDDHHHLSSPHQHSNLPGIDINLPKKFPLPGDRNHNIISSSIPEKSMYDGLPSLSPILSTLDQGSISMSPAAMFLSAFSPSVSVAPLPDDEGEEVDGYKLGSIIGYGGFSTIRRAFSPSGGSVAVKIVRRSDLDSQTDPSQAHDRLENEATIWKMLSHEHILPLFHLVQTSYADFFFMLLCPAGTLYDILKRDGRPALPLDDAGTMFRQVVGGVRYLHEQMGLVHVDLKLENVLVDEMGVCRIGDFGMTRHIGEEIEDDPSTAWPGLHIGSGHTRASTLAHSFRSRRRQSALPRGPGDLGTPALPSLLRHNSQTRRRESTPVSTQSHDQTSQPQAVYEFPPGSLPYAAPELLRTPDPENPYRPHPAQDIWALGVMLYALLTGGVPFVDSFEPRLTMKILLGAYEMPNNIGRCAELVLRGCLEASVAQRWTIATVDDVSWSVGWGVDTEDSCSGTATSELERIAHETRTRTQGPVLRSKNFTPAFTFEHDIISEDAVPELEDDAEPMRGRSVRSASSRSRSTGTRAFSPFTSPWSEIESPSVGPPEVMLLGTPARSSLERPHDRYATKGSVNGKRLSTDPARSTSPSIDPISPMNMDMRGRRGLGGLEVQRPHTMGLGLRPVRSKRAGSQPPRHSAPWAVPSRAQASVGVSPALSVALSMPHRDGGFVLKTGVRSHSTGRV